MYECIGKDGNSPTGYEGYMAFSIEYTEYTWDPQVGDETQ